MKDKKTRTNNLAPASGQFLKLFCMVLIFIVSMIAMGCSIESTNRITGNAFDIAERFDVEDESVSAGDVVILKETKYGYDSIKSTLDLKEEELNDLMQGLGVNDAAKLLEEVESDDENSTDKAGKKELKQKIKQKLESKDERINITGKDRLLASKAAIVKLTDIPNDPKIIGVVSTNPAYVMGWDSDLRDKKNVPVALVGRVPVKVSLENGPISTGDPLTSSTRKGYAAKSINPGRIIGFALEDYKEVAENDKILVFLQPGLYNPSNETLTIQAQQGNIFYSGLNSIKLNITESINETSEINITTEINETLEINGTNQTVTTYNVTTLPNVTTKETIKEIENSVPNDFIFRAGDASSSNDLMVINATTGEVRVKKLKADIVEADNIAAAQQQPLSRIQEVNGSVIIRLG